MPRRRPSPAAFAAAVTVVTWASAFAAIRVGLRGLGAVELSVLRLLVASLALALAAPFLGVRLPRRGDLGRIAVAGLLGHALYQLLLNSGEVRVSAGTASVFVATAPVFTALLATLRLGERLTPTGWAGILVAFAGVCVVGLAEGDGLRFEPAALLVLGAAAASAGYIVTQKPLLGRYRSFEATAYATWAGTLLTLPLVTGLPRALGEAPTPSVLAVVYLGLGPSALGFLTWSIALARVDASVLAPTLYLIPPLATLVAWVWLGEVPAPLAIVGGLVALAGVAVSARWGRSLPQGSPVAPVPARR